MVTTIIFFFIAVDTNLIYRPLEPMKYISVYQKVQASFGLLFFGSYTRPASLSYRKLSLIHIGFQRRFYDWIYQVFQYDSETQERFL